MTTTYLAALATYDNDHHLCNPLFHSCLVLLKADKANDSTLSDIQLTHAYGFLAHQKYVTREISNLEKDLGIWLNIKDTYMELMPEKLIALDNGFGVKLGQPIEISEEDKNNILETIAEQIQTVNEFFADADNDALAELKLQKKEINKNSISNYKSKYREKYYQKTVAEQVLDPNDLVDSVAINSGLITEKRAKYEKLCAEKNIPYFNLSYAQYAHTCKTLIVDLLIKSLQKSNINDPRIAFVGDYKSGFYTGHLPRFNVNDETVIFDTHQTNYKSTEHTNDFAAPSRNWDDINNNNTHTKLQYIQNQHYLAKNIDGSYVLQPFQLHSTDPSNQLQILNENLVLLKRIFNSLLTKSANSDQLNSYINKIDDALAKICYENSIPLSEKFAIYKNTIILLSENNAFNVIKAVTKDKTFNFEKSTQAELWRLTKKSPHKFHLFKPATDSLLPITNIVYNSNVKP